MRANNCWVCSGEGDELCERHERQVEKRAAQFNLPVNHAAWELGQRLTALREAA